MNIKRNGMPQLPTNQDKLIHVASKFGAGNIAEQQGTTRILYDTLPLDGTTALKFFKNPATAVNLLGSILGSNVDNNQGLLGPGEAMTINYVSFQLLQLSAATAAASVVKCTSMSGAVNADLNKGFYAGNFSFLLANQVIMKPVATSCFLPQFNSTITGAFDAEIFKLMTAATIMPNLQFEIDLNLPTYATQALYYIRCTIQGVGSILNLRQTV